MARADAVLRAQIVAPKPVDGAVLDLGAHPIGHLERAKVWSLLGYLEEHAEDPEDRFGRMLMAQLRMPATQLATARALLEGLGLLVVELPDRGGMGARMTYTLTPPGLRIAREGQAIAKLL